MTITRVDCSEPQPREWFRTVNTVDVGGFTFDSCGDGPTWEEDEYAPPYGGRYARDLSQNGERQ